MKNKQDLSRRDFIRNSVMAGGAVLLSGVLPSHAQTPIFPLPFIRKESSLTSSAPKKISVKEKKYDFHSAIYFPV